MNLIQKKINNKSNIHLFREYQYSLIPELINISFEYLKTHGLLYDDTDVREEVIDDISYYSSKHFSTKLLRVYLKQKRPFLEMAVPKLIDKTFFRLNGTLYVPSLYLVASPITLKKSSIILNSLFSPITLYKNDNRMVFLGNNIPASKFLRLYYDEDELTSLGFDTETIENSLNSIGNILNMPPEELEIKDKIEKLFFDKWTWELYSEFYNFENLNIRAILDSAFSKEEPPSFIDMKYKRLVMIEYLLKPFFRAVSHVVNNIIKTKEQPFALPLKMGDIISYFYNTLQKANRSDSINGFAGGILSLKSSLKNPNSDSVLPRSVSNIHPTFKSKICPITVSNNKPGENVTLVPDQKLKSLKFGIFDD